jgi:hypothetical protein
MLFPSTTPKTVPKPLFVMFALRPSLTSKFVWANAQAEGSDELDHERDITLAITLLSPISLETPIATL